MWKSVHKSPPYFIKFTKESEDLFYIGVTDYQRYWILNSSRKSFLSAMKECNEGIDFDDENEFVEKGLDMLNNPDSLKKVSVLPDESNKLLNISLIKAYEFPLKLELRLPKATAEHFFQSVIQPLLQTVCDLRTSQSELRELLKKKDREIEEYKIEGRAPRRLITTVYNDPAHMMKHTCYEENFGDPEVPALLEVTAFGGLQKDIKKPQIKVATIDAKTKEKHQVPSQTKEQCASATVNSSKDIATIKKSSQELEETAAIVTTQINKNEIPRFACTTVENTNSKAAMDSLGPSPKKRPNNRLKY